MHMKTKEKEQANKICKYEKRPNPIPSIYPLVLSSQIERTEWL